MDFEKSDVEWLITLIVMIIIGHPVTINVKNEKPSKKRRRKAKKHKR